MSLVEILAMTAEPVLLLSKGTVSFANDSACRMLGADCVGKKAAELLGGEITRCAASCYLADAVIRGERYIVRVNRLEEGRLVFLRREQETPIQINDAFLYSLRSSLMTLGVATDRLRTAIEDLNELGMLQDMTSLTACYFKLLRLSTNTSFMKDLYEHRVELVPVEMDLSLLLHTSLDALEELIPGLCVERDIQNGLCVQADLSLMRLLVLNLLSNCVRHADARTLRVRLIDLQESVLLGFTDDGRGIPQQEMASVFERCRREYSLSELGEGAGFGLTVARGVTQLHGGTLLLESRPGQGTAVRASFRRLSGTGRLAAGQELISMRDILTGLADCLPLRYFDQKYLD